MKGSREMEYKLVGSLREERVLPEKREGPQHPGVLVMMQR